MKRRTISLGIASALGVGTVRAQGSAASRLRRVGVLFLRTDPAAPWTLKASDRSIGQQLQARGWIEGQNLLTEYAFADYHRERLPALAKRLIGNGAELIYAIGGEAALAAARATSSVPIVFSSVTFPLEQGLIESFARPGRNATGTAEFTGLEVAEKRIQLLRDVLPGARRLGWLLGPTDTLSGGRYDLTLPLRDTASKFGFETQFVEVRRPEAMEPGLAALRDGGAHMLQVGSPFVTPTREVIASFCLRHRLPCATAAFNLIELTGALMCFGPSRAESRTLAMREVDMIDRILNGANPAQIPVERPRAFELVLNLRTAGALGLAIPPALRLRADVVIE